MKYEKNLIEFLISSNILNIYIYIYIYISHFFIVYGSVHARVSEYVIFTLCF